MDLGRSIGLIMHGYVSSFEICVIDLPVCGVCTDLCDSMTNMDLHSLKDNSMDPLGVRSPAIDCRSPLDVSFCEGRCD